MRSTAKKTPYKRIALALSLCTLIIWGILGTGASLAWFTDTTVEMQNIFHFAEFDLSVSHRLDNGDWAEIDSETKLFDENALYEPGYVQVVYLRAENKGEVPFHLRTAVSVTDFTLATNVFGVEFPLQDYLRFGITTIKSEDEMDRSVETRELARAIATEKFGRYDPDVTMLQPGKAAYIALVVTMPEYIGNEANYRGTTVPRVELGVIIKADQIVE